MVWGTLFTMFTCTFHFCMVWNGFTETTLMTLDPTETRGCRMAGAVLSPRWLDISVVYSITTMFRMDIRASWKAQAAQTTTRSIVATRRVSGYGMSFYRSFLAILQTDFGLPRA